MILGDFLNFERHGRRVAFVEETMYRSTRYAYNEVQERTRSILGAFREASIGEGDRVILWGENSARWAITFYACVLARVVAVPIDASFSAAFAEKIRRATEAKLVLSDRKGDEWNRLLQTSPVDWKPEAPDQNTLLEIVYTSGTTSEPKGVMITHGNLLANLVPIYTEYQKYKHYAALVAPVGFVHLIPLSHLFGQIMGLMIPQMLGGKVIFTDPAPSTVIRAVKRNRASAVICVPRELEILHSHIQKQHEIQLPADRGNVLRRWWRFRRVHRDFGWKFWAFIVGGAALPVVEEDFWGALGYAVVQGYGLTETAPAVTITHPFRGIKRGSVGKKLPGLEIKLAEDGEILVRGSNVSPGYFQDQQATSEVLEDGWLRTGDLGTFDDDGSLRLLGRKKEVIVTAEGLNVYPSDVEAVLNSDSRIRESAVVEHEGKVHAVVILASGVSSDLLPEIVRETNRRLERFQRIESFSIWPDPGLPRTSMGKLKRGEIAGFSAVHPTGMAGPTTTNALLSQILSGQDAKLEMELGLSSLDRIELMTELERSTGLEIDDLAFSRAQTLSDVRKLIDRPNVEVEQHYPYWNWPQWFPVRMFRFLVHYLLMYPIMPVRIHMEVSGIENLRGIKAPVLFVANHQSILDVPVILKALPFRLRESLAPAMGTGRTKFERAIAGIFFNTYPLPYTSVGLRGAIRQTGSLADRGYCPLVFPEGKRTEDGHMLPFRPGIGVIAKQTRLSVVPVVLRGLFEMWPVFARGPRKRGIARVEFGPSFDFAGKDPAEITSTLETWYKQQQ